MFFYTIIFILSFYTIIFRQRVLCCYFSAVISPMFFTKLVLQHPFNGSLCIAVPPPLQPLFNGSKPPTYETAGMGIFWPSPLPHPLTYLFYTQQETLDIGPKNRGGGGDGEWIFRKNLYLNFLHSFPFSFKVTVSRKKNYI